MTVRTDDNAGTISHDQGPVERRRATTRTMRHEHDPDRPCADPRAQMSDVLPTSSSRPSPRTAASPPPRRAGGAFGPSLSDDLRTCPLAFICRDPPRPPENVGKGGSEGSPKGPTGIQAGRRAPGHFHCGSCRRDPDAAVKGTLRRPPAALDRRSFRLEALAPNESGTTGAVEPSGRNVRHMGEGHGAEGDKMLRMRRWLVPLCVAGTAALAGCGGSTTSPKAASAPLSVLMGVAQQCSGPPGQPAHPVQVTVYRGSHVVAKETKLGSHQFKLSLPAGKYRVTTDQSYAVPVTVTLQSGRVAHIAVLSNCD